MAEICRSFPPDEFFAQHKLDAKQNPQYDDVKCFLIWAAAANPGFFLNELLIGLTEFEFTDIDTYEDNLEALLKLDVQPAQFPAVAGTKKGSLPSDILLKFLSMPLDFSVEKSSAIIIRLVGDFWQFSSTMGAISTKHDLGDQYHTPRRHWLIGNTVKNVKDGKDLPGHRCISFFSGRPCDRDFFGTDRHVKHGMSFNLDLIMPNGDFLPITFDPDVENKGGVGP